jgi:peptidoglycan/LPS O-acetylase OafA/YrhL
MARTQHFLALDFLRGTAALCVVLLHWFDGVGLPWFGYGYLAVDFFFLLSGFVVAHAYDERLLSNLPIRHFMWLRFVRLYPMILAGIAVGLLRYVLHDHMMPGAMGSLSEYLPLVFANLFMIPVLHTTSLVPGSGPGVNYPLDQPLWSLFYEGVAYFFYAAFINRFSRTVLTTIVIVGLMSLMTMLCVGWTDSPSVPIVFASQAPRVIFSFSLGVLIYRLHKGMSLRSAAAGPIVLSLVLIAVLGLPHSLTAWWFESGVVALLLPAVLVLGANNRPTGAVARASKLMGDLSYPVYALHVPLLWMITGTLKVFKVYDLLSPILLGAFAIAVVCLISWLALKLYDEPVRRLLLRAVVLKRVDTPMCGRHDAPASTYE